MPRPGFTSSLKSPGHYRSSVKSSWFKICSEDSMILTSVMTALTFPTAPTRADMAHMPPHNGGDCNQSNSHAPQCAHGAAGALGALASKHWPRVSRVAAEAAQQSSVRLRARRTLACRARRASRCMRRRSGTGTRRANTRPGRHDQAPRYIIDTRIAWKLHNDNGSAVGPYTPCKLAVDGKRVKRTQWRGDARPRIGILRRGRLSSRSV